MNIFLLTLLIFVLVYLALNWFIKSSSARISKSIRNFVIISSIVLAVVMAYAGRFIFSLPFLMMVLPLVKTKAGFTLLQVLRFWSLLRILKIQVNLILINLAQTLTLKIFREMRLIKY